MNSSAPGRELPPCVTPRREEASPRSPRRCSSSRRPGSRSKRGRRSADSARRRTPSCRERRLRSSRHRPCGRRLLPQPASIAINAEAAPNATSCLLKPSGRGPRSQVAARRGRGRAAFRSTPARALPSSAPLRAPQPWEPSTIMLAPSWAATAQICSAGRLLALLRECLALVGGRLRIESGRDAGTTPVVEVPAA
jgi:hypothetical protein